MKHNHRGKSSGLPRPPRQDIKVRIEHAKDGVLLIDNGNSVQRVINNTNGICLEVGPEIGAPESLRLVAVDASDPTWAGRVTHTVLKVNGGHRQVLVPFLGGAEDPLGVQGPACLARWKERRSRELRVLPAGAPHGGNLGEVEDPQHMD